MSDNKAQIRTRGAFRGVFNVATGRFLARLIGYGTSLLIIRWLTPEEYGIATIVYALPSLVNMFNHFGFGFGAQKFISSYRAKGEKSTAKAVFQIDFIFKVILGFTTTLISISLAGYYSMVIGKPEITSAIQLASFYIFAGVMQSLAGDALLPLEATKQYGIMITLSEVCRGLYTIVLVQFGFGVYGVISGFVLALGSSALFGLIVAIRLFRDTKQLNVNYGALFRKVLRYGLPIGIGTSIVFTVLTLNDVILTFFVDLSSIGDYGVAKKMVTFISLIAVSLGNVLYPTFSKLDLKTHATKINRLYRYSIVYFTLLVIPITMSLFLSAQPLVRIFAGRSYDPNSSNAWFYFQIYLIGQLFSGLGQLPSKQLLLGSGETKLVARVQIITAILRLSLMTSFIPLFTYVEQTLVLLIVFDWLSKMPGAIYFLRIVTSKYKVEYPRWQIGGIYVSVLISSVIVLGLYPLTPSVITPFIKALLPLPPSLGVLTGYVIDLIMNTITFSLTFILCMVGLKIVRKQDVDFLIQLSQDMPIIGKLLSKTLTLIRPVIRT